MNFWSCQARSEHARFCLNDEGQFEGREGGMTTTKTTIWRPNVRVTLDEYGEVEDTEQEGEEVTKKGTKRKRAPPTKGPCEHGVKYRSKCKVCSACPHGKWRRYCKECGGSQICEHDRRRSRCKECKRKRSTQPRQ